MGRDGGGTCELRITVHTTHGIGHTVGSGTSRHIVGMQGTARTAAGGHGEILLALLDALLLVGAGHGMLEACGVGGITGDGHIHALAVHDGNALTDIVGTVAANIGALAFGVADLADDLQLAGEIVKLSLHIGEAMDAGTDKQLKKRFMIRFKNV